jgi:hypothetical protein
LFLFGPKPETQHLNKKTLYVEVNSMP